MNVIHLPRLQLWQTPVNYACYHLQRRDPFLNDVDHEMNCMCLFKLMERGRVYW